jgi:ParB family chromosome partitioning protein
MKLDHHRTVESVPLDLINPPAKWRRIYEANVDILAKSMSENGQLQPIGLLPAKEQGRYDMAWGESRRLAKKKLNSTTIDAVVLRGLSQAEADLLTLEENIARNGYFCVLEEACAHTEHKRLYLVLHPETARGGDRRSERASKPNKSDLIEPFTAYVANARNESVDRIEQLVKIGTALGPYANTLYGTPIKNSFTELLALSRCSNEDLPRLVDLICSKQFSKVSDARNLISGGAALSQSAGKALPEERDKNPDQSELVPSEGKEIPRPSGPNNYSQYVTAARKKLADLEDAGKMDPLALVEYLVAVLPPRNPNLWQRFVSSVYNPMMGNKGVLETLRKVFERQPTYLGATDASIAAGGQTPPLLEWADARLEEFLKARILVSDPPTGFCPHCGFLLSYAQSRFHEGRIELRLYCEICRREVNFQCPNCIGKRLRFRLPKHLFCAKCLFEFELETLPRSKVNQDDAFRAFEQGASDPRHRGMMLVFRTGGEATVWCSWDERGIFIPGERKLEGSELKELNDMSGFE